MPGVYISFPFCAQKCTYCNFASGVLPRSLEPQYLAALEAEINAHSWRWTPDTLYIGGGTPSQIEPAGLLSLVSTVARASGAARWRESTVEAAPGSLTEERVRAWASAGINRVSFGVQSFVAGEIARTGRKHRADTVVADVAMLARHSITNFNIDLIAGLAGQTRTSWNESLDWIERLAPAHVSVYMLEVDEDSRLGQEILLGGKRYGASDTPSDELTVEFYQTAVERLHALGIERYEISNFARPGFESVHNLKYWRMEPYAGFGADAHSFDGETRRQNVESAQEYVDRHGDVCQALEPARADEERMFTGLRLTEGLRPSALDWERFGDPIRRRLEEGLLEAQDGVIRLTARGILLSNEVFSDFVTV